MTTKTIEQGLLKINGRVHYLPRIDSIVTCAPGRYIVKRNDVAYIIDGGKRIGGTRKDWFVQTAGWTKPIDCTSLIDAVRLVNGM